MANLFITLSAILFTYLFLHIDVLLFHSLLLKTLSFLTHLTLYLCQKKQLFVYVSSPILFTYMYIFNLI